MTCILCAHIFSLSAYYANGNEFCTTSVPIIGNEWWGAMEPYPYIARLYQHVFTLCVFYDGFLQLGHFCAFRLCVEYMNVRRYMDAISSPSNSQYCAGNVKPCHVSMLLKRGGTNAVLDSKSKPPASKQWRGVYRRLTSCDKYLNFWNIFAALRDFLRWFVLFTTCL